MGVGTGGQGGAPLAVALGHRQARSAHELLGDQSRADGERSLAVQITHGKMQRGQAMP